MSRMHIATLLTFFETKKVNPQLTCENVSNGNIGSSLHIAGELELDQGKRCDAQLLLPDQELVTIEELGSDLLPLLFFHLAIGVERGLVRQE